MRSGLFRFLKVPPGKYAVTVTMPGFTTVTRENVIVSVGKNTQVDVQLKLSTVQENGHGHERDAAHRHAQGRDGPELLARAS